MPGFNLTEKEARELLQKIGGNSEAADKLSKLLKPEQKKEVTAAAELSDDEAWVKAKWEEASSVTGEALVCFFCHKTFKELRCDACEDCFKVWALECKPKKKKRRKHGNQHAGNDRSL